MILESPWVFFSVGSRQKHRTFGWNEIHPFSADSLEILLARILQRQNKVMKELIHINKCKCSLYLTGVFLQTRWVNWGYIHWKRASDWKHLWSFDSCLTLSWVVWVSSPGPLLDLRIINYQKKQNSAQPLNRAPSNSGGVEDLIYSVHTLFL